MARKHRQRDTTDIATPSRNTRPRAVRSPSHSVTLAPVDMRLFEDRRTFHPEQADRPAIKIGGSPARLESRNRPATKKVTKWQKDVFGDTLRSQTKGAIAFKLPSRVILCIRRNIRRQIMFALRLRKKGSGASRRRYNWISKIGC